MYMFTAPLATTNNSLANAYPPSAIRLTGIGGGRCACQPGQVRKEAAVTSKHRVVCQSLSKPPKHIVMADITERLSKITSRFDELRDMLSSGKVASSEFSKLSKEYSDLEPVANAVNRLKNTHSEIAELTSMLEQGEADKEMKKLAEEELASLNDLLPKLEQEVKLMLLPKDEADERNAIVEIRAGTGGDEAALFAAELFDMYRRYSALHNWKFETIQISENALGGYKDASATITGRNVFARMKFESGVHRVQRVPQTEAQGRIHTSTATVAVLPEAEEVDVKIEEKDLRIDVFRSSGPGGQSVNTTDSAVRITHIPTGLVVSQQDEKSQLKNKAKALKILRARLYEMERERKEAERAATRKGQIGTGERSERIRTYNFPQGRVTDHRVNLTLYKIDKVMTGEALDEIIDTLVTNDQAEKLAEFE